MRSIAKQNPHLFLQITGTIGQGVDSYGLIRLRCKVSSRVPRDLPHSSMPWSTSISEDGTVRQLGKSRASIAAGYLI